MMSFRCPKVVSSQTSLLQDYYWIAIAFPNEIEFKSPVCVPSMLNNLVTIENHDNAFSFMHVKQIQNTSVFEFFFNCFAFLMLKEKLKFAFYVPCSIWWKLYPNGWVIENKTSRELGWVKKRRKASKYVSHFECTNSRNFATMNSICEYTFTASYSFLLKQLIWVATCVVHEQLVQLICALTLHCLPGWTSAGAMLVSECNV